MCNGVNYYEGQYTPYPYPAFGFAQDKLPSRVEGKLIEIEWNPGDSEVRAVVQRVKRASVEIDGEIIAAIGVGLLVLLGVSVDDEKRDAAYLAEKIANLRIFEDAEGKMNLSLKEVGGSALVVSQFTLYGDCRRGRRPSFTDAAGPEKGEALYNEFLRELRAQGITVETGQFGAKMLVKLENDGPVTLIVES